MISPANALYTIKFEFILNMRLIYASPQPQLSIVLVIPAFVAIGASFLPRLS